MFSLKRFFKIETQWLFRLHKKLKQFSFLQNSFLLLEWQVLQKILAFSFQLYQ